MHIWKKVPNPSTNIMVEKVGIENNLTLNPPKLKFNKMRNLINNNKSNLIQNFFNQIFKKQMAQSYFKHILE